MKSKLVAALFCAVMLGACTSQPIYSVPEQPISTNVKNAGLKDVHLAIVRGATHLGWVLKEQGPNSVLATLDLRTHQAVVEIAYNTKTYSIAYKESSNLNYDGKSIHRNYNGWVHRLQDSINVELNNL
ncbi:MAG TPA: hypothetical protein VH105_11355 [Burkholderiales bacterium]|nr:hypothetical protein [Burkholderiales bacterium]